jgi:hygromycin-B 7''-O-kinase
MNNASWTELAVAACDHAGVEYGSIDTIATWDQEFCDNAVYYIGGQHYLKVFGPAAERQFHVERSVLRILEHHHAIPAPRIVAAAERSQIPPYLILTAVAGSTAEDIWDDLSRAEQLAVARELGAITAAIHRLPQQDLAAVEQQFGGRSEHVEEEQARAIALIEATETMSAQRRANMICFLQGEALEYLAGPPKLTHRELANNHIYLSRETGSWQVAGFIDWADAMLGPSQWDVGFLWLWTFNRDHEAMRECLRSLYADSRPPEQFARRCLAAILHTHSMSLLWPEFVERGGRSESIDREMAEFLFPPDVFGPPD